MGRLPSVPVWPKGRDRPRAYHFHPPGSAAKGRCVTHSITSSARASSTAHRGNRASLWNWLELQFVGGRIDEPEFGVGLLRNRSAEKREVFVGVRPVLPIAHSADCISDLIAEATLRQRVRQRAITRPLVLRGREEICNSLIMSGAP